MKGQKVLSIILALVAVAALVFGFVTNGQKGDLQKTADDLKAQVESLKTQLTSAEEATKVAETAKQAAEEAQKTAEEAQKAAEDAAQKAADDAAKAIEEATRAAEEAAQKKIEEAQKAAEEAAQKVEEKAADAAEDVTDAAKEAADTVGEAADAAKEGAAAVVEEAAAAVEGAADAAKEGAAAVVEEVTGAVEGAVDAAKEGAAAVVEEVTGAVEGAVDAAKEEAAAVVEEVTGAVEGAVDAAKEGAAAVVEEAAAAVEEVAGVKAEAGVMTHEEYIKAEMDTTVTVETYVQDHQNWFEKDGIGKMTVYCQSEDGAYFIYEMNMSKEEAEKLVPGTKIRVTGFKSEWSGEVEITDATYEILEADPFVAEPLDITEIIGTDDYILHQNERVCFTGKIADYDGNGAAFAYKNETEKSDDLYFKVQVGEFEVACTVEFYLRGKDTDVYKAVENLKVGDEVVLDGYLYWYEGANPHIIGVEVK